MRSRQGMCAEYFTGSVRTKQNYEMEPDSDHVPSFTPHALCLTVFLSPASFLRSHDKTRGKSTTADVKVSCSLTSAVLHANLLRLTSTLMERSVLRPRLLPDSTGPLTR